MAAEELLWYSSHMLSAHTSVRPLSLALTWSVLPRAPTKPRPRAPSVTCAGPYACTPLCVYAAGRWALSQYPMEAEILMPPCTALQLVETSVDKDTLVVSFRPTITRPEVRSGTDDITRWHLARAGVERRRAAEVAAASAALEEEKRRRGAEEAAYEWRLAMSATRLRGSQMHAAQLVTNLCESKRREIAERMKHSTTQSRMLLRDTAATLDAQVAAAEQAEAARKASAGASVDVEQVASKQLQWALLSMNPRLARTVQQEIVQQDRQGAAAAGAAGEQ